MTISGVSNVNQTATPAAASTANSTKVDHNDFLALLVAQIKNQDPLNPMDGTAFTAQLAQFSSLEQLYNVNTNLNTLQSSQSALNGTQALSYIGKTVTADGDSVVLDDNGGGKLAFDLSGEAAGVAARIYGPTGELLRSVEAGAMGQGPQHIDWDGKDANGSRLAPGKYSFEILAMDELDRMVPATTYSSGDVTGLVYENGSPFLIVGDDRVALSQVVRVLDPAAKAD